MQVQGRTLHTTKTLFSCPTLLAPKKSYIFGFSHALVEQSPVSVFPFPSLQRRPCVRVATLAPPSDTSLISSPLSSARVTSVSGSNPALTASYTHRIPIHPAHLTIITFPYAENNDAKNGPYQLKTSATATVFNPFAAWGAEILTQQSLRQWSKCGFGILEFIFMNDKSY